MISHFFRPFCKSFPQGQLCQSLLDQQSQCGTSGCQVRAGRPGWNRRYPGYPVMAVDGLFHGKSWIKKADDDIGYPHFRKLPNVLFWSVLRICETHHLQKYYWKSVGLNTIERIENYYWSVLDRWSSTTQRQYSLPGYCGFAPFDSLFFLPKDGCIYIISNWYLCTSRVKQTGTVDRHYIITLHYVRWCCHHRPHRPFHSNMHCRHLVKRCY